MKKKLFLPMPVKRALFKLGSDISDARRRRRIPFKLLAERTNFSRSTLSKIEKGDPTVSLGAYSFVLYILGMTNRLSDLADVRYDKTGLILDEENLPKRVRLPSSNNENKNE